MIPMTIAFSAFISSQSYGIESGLTILLAVISIAGGLFLATNMVLYTLFFRDNSPFSKLPFASSVNFQEEFRVILKVFLGIYGSISINKNNDTVIQAFCGFYLCALLLIMHQRYTKGGIILYPYNRINEIGIAVCIWTLISTFV